MPSLTNEQIATISALADEGLSTNAIATRMGISWNTVNAVLKAGLTDGRATVETPELSVEMERTPTTTTTEPAEVAQATEDVTLFELAFEGVITVVKVAASFEEAVALANNAPPAGAERLIAIRRLQ